ncbi:protein ILITYHIA [Tanacetum coccineum]|uniref:Protein ILITYHIA n=1 Tax=Tanacetum coccineum TaxID=301880 RepID=A0ABQ5J5Q7_9ASTR
MDINASFGGFAAALDSPKSWVMNVVSTLAGWVTQKIQILRLADSYAEHQVTINIMPIWPSSSEFFYYRFSGYVIGAIPSYHGSVAPALNELCLGLKPKEVAPALSSVYAKDVHVRMACFLLYRPVLFLRSHAEVVLSHVNYNMRMAAAGALAVVLYEYPDTLHESLTTLFSLYIPNSADVLRTKDLPAMTFLISQALERWILKSSVGEWQDTITKEDGKLELANKYYHVGICRYVTSLQLARCYIWMKTPCLMHQCAGTSEVTILFSSGLGRESPRGDIGSVAAGTSEVTILFSSGLGRESPRGPLQLEGRGKLVICTYLIVSSLKAGGSLPKASLKIGVVLSRGLVPGRHKSGLQTIYRKMNKDNTMYGFRGGAAGVMKGSNDSTGDTLSV